jgi:sugar phosphate isomerase/epimerase
MQLLLARHLWGIAETWEQSFPRIQAAGYRAIEAPVPAPEDRERFRALLEKYGFAYIAMIFTAGATVAEHAVSFRAQVADGLGLQPLMINSHSGQDAWDEGQSRDFFTQALAVQSGLETPLCHETHRGRILFNPWVARRVLGQFEGLRLCCDLSHWVCVGERLLDDQLDIIQLCAERCIHLHTRVGYEEGPQVPDPRAPEYQRHLEAHERWWQTIWESQYARGLRVSSLTPEYGPPDYLHTLPYSQTPVANLWEICDWQAQREAKRFEAWHKTKS